MNSHCIINLYQLFLQNKLLHPFANPMIQHEAKGTHEITRDYRVSMRSRIKNGILDTTVIVPIMTRNFHSGPKSIHFVIRSPSAFTAPDPLANISNMPIDIRVSFA